VTHFRLLTELIRIGFSGHTPLNEKLSNLQQAPRCHWPSDTLKFAGDLLSCPGIVNVLANDCLTRGLFLFRAAVLSGRQPFFHLGVRKREREYQAHAWVTDSLKEPLGEVPDPEWRKIYTFPNINTEPKEHAGV